MSNSNEVLKFTGQPENDKNSYNNPINGIDGSSALKLEPEFSDDVDKDRDAQIGIIREEFVKPEETQNILPLTNTDAGVQRAPRGVVGPVGNQGRETSGGDRTGGRKKGLGVKIMAGVMAGVAAVGIGYGVFKDKIDSFFGGGVDPNDLPPTYPVESPGEMPSQSENIESPTPSAEVTPEITATPETTEAPTPTLDEFGFSEERKAELNQQIQDFLNYRGEYSEENIQKYLLPTKDSYYNLGLIGGSESYHSFQAWLFDYVEKNGDLLLIVGFDGKNDQRLVTVLNIPLHFLDMKPDFGVSFIEFEEWNSQTKERSAGSSGDLGVIKSHLPKGKPILIDSIITNTSDEELKKIGGEDLVTISHYYDNGFLYANNLVSEISNNGIEPSADLDSEGKRIHKVEKISDIGDLDNDKMPVINRIIYVKTK